MGDMKSIYLCHEVTPNLFCDRTVTGFKPFPSNFSVYCYYFETYVAMNEEIEKFLMDILSCGHI